MAIRVLWLVKGLGPGGAEHLLASAAENHDLSRFQIECMFVVPAKDQLTERLERAGVRCHCVSRHPGDKLWPVHLRHLIVEGEWDIVHAHSPLLAAAGRVAVRSMRPGRQPALVSTEHNEWSTFARPTKWANRLTSRLDGVALAVSESTRRSMSPKAAERTQVLHHGVDVDAVASQCAHRDRVRSELGIGTGEFVIGTVANYRTQKDYPNLLRAMRMLLDQGVAARLVAVGQGPLESEIQSMVQEHDLDAHVVLTGYRADATRIMSSFDVFTLASLHEGLPVALMDAFALGLAVVATKVGGINDVLSDGQDALLVSPQDPAALASAWSRLHTDSELRGKLAAAAAERAPSFDIGAAVSRIESIYVEIANRNVEQLQDLELSTDVEKTARPRASQPSRASLGTDFTIREATEDDRGQILALGRSALGWPNDERVDELFDWKHEHNAFGRSVTFVAVDGERVIGFRAFLRWQFSRGDATLDAVRAVDTVTDPEWQGRGVFRSLTMHGVDVLRRAEVDFIFNTPNDASKPGYVAMGWRDVGKLPTTVRFSGLGGARRAIGSRVPAELWSTPSEIGEAFDDWFSPETELPRQPKSARALTTAWTHDRLQWRFGGDLLGYRVVVGERDKTGVIVRERRRGASAELVSLLALGMDHEEADTLVARAVRGTGVSHILRLGRGTRRQGFVPMPGAGPTFTWRALTMHSPPPLANWALSLADVELF